MPKDAGGVIRPYELNNRVPKRYRDIYPVNRQFIEVPCGKCIACLRNRQNAMVSRLYAEAEKRGFFGFVTLTYDEDNLPLAETVYCVDTETGEASRVGLEYKDKDGNISVDRKPRIVHGHRVKDIALSLQMRSIKPGPMPRYIDRPLFDGNPIDGKVYFARVTPSACREDVRLWLKSCRVQYVRETGKELPEFSYACVTEYGPRTCRPHYHLCFLGLPEDILRWFVDRWSYGRQTDLKMVNRVNADKSDGYRLAAQYIGKYVTKGKFECASVQGRVDLCDAEKPRLIQSIGLGASLADKLRDYMFAFDYVGKYDPKTLIKEDGKPLTPAEIRSLVPVVCRRFTYTIGQTPDGKPIRFAVPQIIRQKVFGFETVNKRGKTVPLKDAYGRRVFSPIYYLASAYLCDKYASLHWREFEQFLAANVHRPPGQVCVEYANRICRYSPDSPNTREENSLERFYQQSIF